MVYEPCYDDPPAAAEADDQAATTAEQAFPDYDQYEPGPVYDPAAAGRRAPVLSCRAERPRHPRSHAKVRPNNSLFLRGCRVKVRSCFSVS